MMKNALIVAALALLYRYHSAFTQGDLSLRAATWWRLISEYDAMVAVYESHVAEEFFVYGKPSDSFAAISSHPAFLELDALRRPLSISQAADGRGTSRVRFVEDAAVLPTYLPVEEGAAACLGALGLAVADLWQLRGGPPQEISVSQSGAALSTAGCTSRDSNPQHRVRRRAPRLLGVVSADHAASVACCCCQTYSSRSRPTRRPTMSAAKASLGPSRRRV